MTTLICNKCGKKRALSKENENALLSKNGDIEQVKAKYLCRTCKSKAQ